MPLVGRKPKPDGQKRHRNAPRHAWVDVVDVPYDGPRPTLAPFPRPSSGPTPPEPSRPLGRMGAALWDRIWRANGDAPQDVDTVLMVCEQMDERVALRVSVLKGEDWHGRTALRALDHQISTALNAIGAPLKALPLAWPAATRDWWDTVSTMPHCALWNEGDWQFALDTALLAAAYHAGDMRAANELRQREKIMGTTSDARRDSRIRYVPPVDDDTEDATVTAMDAYRRMAAST